MAKSVAAVILAAGVGSRMRSDKTKQKIEILGKSVLRRTLEAFDKCTLVTSITLVIRKGEEDFVRGEIIGIAKPVNVVFGGATRAESARLGFAAIPSDAEFVAIHDAARCLITDNMIKSVAEEAFSYGAATAYARSFLTSVSWLMLLRQLLQWSARKSQMLSQRLRVSLHLLMHLRNNHEVRTGT